MGVVEIVVLDEIVEAVGTERSPGASDGDGELAASGIEFDLVGVGSFVFEEIRLEESAIVGGAAAGLAVVVEDFGFAGLVEVAGA